VIVIPQAKMSTAKASRAWRRWDVCFRYAVSWSVLAALRWKEACQGVTGLRAPAGVGRARGVSGAPSPSTTWTPMLTGFFSSGEGERLEWQIDRDCSVVLPNLGESGETGERREKRKVERRLLRRRLDGMFGGCVVWCGSKCLV